MMDIQKLINKYRRRAMSPDDAGGVMVGTLGLLQILDVLENSRAQLAALAKQESDYYVCDDCGGLEVNRHNEFSCGRSGFPVYRAAPPAPLLLPDDVPDMLNLSLEQQTEFNQGFWYGVEKVKRLNSAPPAPFVVNEVLHTATAAIYFDDSSDFGSALWSIVRAINPEIAELLEKDAGAAFSKTAALSSCNREAQP